MSLCLTALIASAATTETYDQAVSQAVSNAGGAGTVDPAWRASDASMVTIPAVAPAPGPVTNPHGLVYDSSGNVVVRTAASYASFLGSFVAGSTITYRNDKNPTDDSAAWVTTGNELTNLLINNHATSANAISLVEQGIGVNTVGSGTPHNVMIEYAVVPDDNHLMRPTKNPDIATYNKLQYGNDNTFYPFPAVPPAGMTAQSLSNFEGFYANHLAASYPSAYPWTQLGYTYFWGQTFSSYPPTIASQIQGMSEFVILPKTTVNVYGIYSTLSYIYTRNDGTNLSTASTAQYGNGFASFDVTGGCDSVWAGSRFQVNTKSSVLTPNTITIESGATLSSGQGILVWSPNYDLTNNGTITGATSSKIALSGTDNIAVLFHGDTTSYVTGQNHLINTGTISSPGTAVQIDAGTTLIENNAGGTISGANYGVDIVTATSDDFTLRNAGGTISSNNYAIYAAGTATDTVDINGGTVNGKILMGVAHTDTLTIRGGATLGLTLSRDTAGSAQIISGDTKIAEFTNVTVAPTISGTSNIQDKETFLMVDAESLTHTTLSNINIQNDSSHPMITLAPSISVNQVILTASRNNAYYANNSGNFSLGATLDGLANKTVDGSDMAQVIGALDSSGSAGNATQLQPTTDNSAPQTSYETMLQFINNILSRFDNVSQVQTRGSTDAVTDASLDTTGIWAQGFDTYLHQNPRGMSNGYNANVWGTSVGFDTPLLNNSIVGLSAGYARDGVRTKDSSARSDIDSYAGSLYGSYAKDDYYVDLVASFAYNVYDASRHVAFGAIDRKPTADYGGQQYSGYIEGGYTFKNKNVTLTPLGSLQYSHLHINGYTEENGGAIDLTVIGQDYDAFQTGLGARLAYKVVSKDYTLIPDLHVKWLYDFIGDNQQATSTFTGGGASFATNGFTPAQSSYDFGTRLVLLSKEHITLTLNYDFELKEDFYSHAGYGNVRYDF